MASPRASLPSGNIQSSQEVSPETSLDPASLLEKISSLQNEIAELYRERDVVGRAGLQALEEKNAVTARVAELETNLDNTRSELELAKKVSDSFFMTLTHSNFAFPSNIIFCSRVDTLEILNAHYIINDST